MVFALVVVFLFVQLLDEHLHLRDLERWSEVLHVVFVKRVLPIVGIDLLQVDADVEEAIVPCAFRKALSTKSLEAWWTVLDGLVWLNGWLDRGQAILHVLFIQRVELFKRSGSAIVFEGIAHAVITCEIRQVQEVAGVTALDQDL